MNENKKETIKVDTNLQEKAAPGRAGMPMLLLFLALAIGGIALGIIIGATEGRWMIGEMRMNPFRVPLTVLCILISLFSIFMLCGLRVLKPNEAYVLTLFGKYYGTLKGPGFFWATPFAVAASPVGTGSSSGIVVATEGKKSGSVTIPTNKLSLKTMTLNNDKQKINDQLGNPIIIGIVVIWRVVNTAQAMFNVENYVEFLSIQCDSALRNIVRLYPYDTPSGEGDEKSLRGSSQEIADKLCAEIQTKVELAGLEIMEARITNLAYAPEIAASMLQRQQASAVIDAKNMIVEGAVGMVEMALKKLSENNVVELDEERKAAMVSNLLVVLCGNKDAQPIVNSGTIY